jgi:hypothetical protein
LRRRLARQGDQQRRHLDQAAATSHGVDEPGKERCQQEEQQVELPHGQGLLADAKAGEDFPEQIVRAELAGDP